MSERSMQAVWNIAGTLVGFLGLALVWMVNRELAVGVFLMIFGNNLHLAVKVRNMILPLSAPPQKRTE